MTACFAAILICNIGAQELQETTFEGAHAWKSAESGPPVHAPFNTNFAVNFVLFLELLCGGKGHDRLLCRDYNLHFWRTGAARDNS